MELNGQDNAAVIIEPLVPSVQEVASPMSLVPADEAPVATKTSLTPVDETAKLSIGQKAAKGLLPELPPSAITDHQLMPGCHVRIRQLDRYVNLTQLLKSVGMESSYLRHYNHMTDHFQLEERLSGQPSVMQEPGSKDCWIPAHAAMNLMSYLVVFLRKTDQAKKTGNARLRPRVTEAGYRLFNCLMKLSADADACQTGKTPVPPPDAPVVSEESPLAPAALSSTIEQELRRWMPSVSGDMQGVSQSLAAIGRVVMMMAIHDGVMPATTLQAPSLPEPAAIIEKPDRENYITEFRKRITAVSLKTFEQLQSILIEQVRSGWKEAGLVRNMPTADEWDELKGAIFHHRYYYLFPHYVATLPADVKEQGDDECRKGILRAALAPHNAGGLPADNLPKLLDTAGRRFLQSEINEIIAAVRKEFPGIDNFCRMADYPQPASK